MIVKTSAIAVAAIALLGMAASTQVQAQESCQGMYTHMMGIYHANPYSPEYARMLGFYNARCLSGAANEAPQPYAYREPAYAEPAPYAYEPAPVDPAAAIVGAAVVGGVLATEGDRRHRDRDDWDNRHGDRDDWDNRGWRR